VLPNIPIQEQRKDYMTDQGRLARARRLVVQMELFDRVRGRFRQTGIIDTGAPFSVFPFSIWNGQNVSWIPLGSQLLNSQGRPDPEALKWLGVPCDLGEIQVVLLDEMQRRTRSLRVIAKLPHSAVPSHLEKDILLGYNFLADNGLTLTLHPASHTTAGSLTDVVGFLTVR
jgi:hypothetical protein